MDKTNKNWLPWQRPFTDRKSNLRLIIYSHRSINPENSTKIGPVDFEINGLTGKKGSPYSITERTVPELIPVLGSQPAGDVSHKPGGRLPLLSARPTVTLAALKGAATNLTAW